MMTIANIYLRFDGNCKQAFDYYKSIFGGEYASVSTFDEMPSISGVPPISEEMKNRIMHISLPISRETVIMGSDIGDQETEQFVHGNNFSLLIRTDSKEKADHIFNNLSLGGHITMPMNHTFWGDYFGTITDQFGINWMVSFNSSKQE